MIYLIRHGLDDEKFIGGWSNQGLMEAGRKQVEDTICYLKENPIYFQKIYSSDLLRAKETAEIIQKEFPVAILFDQRLREQDKGYFNGMVEKKAKQEHPDFFQKITENTIYPNGESLQGFWDRMSNVLPYFLCQDNILLVTHRGVINYLYYQTNQIPIDMDKEKFQVTHASLHEYNPKTKQVRKLY